MRAAEDALWAAYIADRTVENRNAIVGFHKGAMYHLALMIAKKYNLRSKRTVDEILSDTALILIRCVELFNVDSGFRFTTYYYTSCYRSIVQNLRRIDRGRLPTISVDDNVHGNVIVSRDRLFNFEDESGCTVDDLLSCLDSRESKIMTLRWLEGVTLTEIGKRFGITKERVRQLESRAIKKIRKSLGTTTNGGQT